MASENFLAMGPCSHAGDGVRAFKFGSLLLLALPPMRAAASQQEVKATMGMLNIICSPYLFIFPQQAFSLTLRARVMLLLAPFPLSEGSMFVFRQNYTAWSPGASFFPPHHLGEEGRTAVFLG